MFRLCRQNHRAWCGCYWCRDKVWRDEVREVKRRRREEIAKIVRARNDAFRKLTSRDPDASYSVGRLPCCSVCVDSLRHSIHCPEAPGKPHTAEKRREAISRSRHLNPNLIFRR